jgi:uncharacterized protein (DUF1330 family)
MKAYVIALETIHNEAMFAEYRGQVMPTLAPFGASFVVRGGALTVLEGDWQHQRTVIIEFPSRAARCQPGPSTMTRLQVELPCRRPITAW